jgi:tetratricopeptide (TPR) repeat protein
MNSVGICFRVLKNYNEALIYFNAAINISNKAAFYLNRSYCYQSLGKIEEARNDALTANKGGMAISKEYAAQLGLK